MSDIVRKIVSELGGRCHGGGSSGLCFCPAHDNKRTPALSVSLGDGGKLLVKCQAGCTQEAVIAALKKRDLWPDQAKNIQPVSQADQRRQKREWNLVEYETMCRVREILYVANQNHTKDDHATLRRYLSGRGIEAVPENALLLRPAQSKTLKIGPRFPAMVLPIVRGGRAVAAHVTWLTRDGSRKLKGETPRRVFGPMAGGYTHRSLVHRVVFH